jgi:hypothetical protein
LLQIPTQTQINKIYKPNSPVVISDRNTKIGKIHNISLPPITSCGGAPCAKEGCYSLKAYCRFPTVRTARWHNWRVWKEEPKRYFDDIDCLLQLRKPEYFRFHVDGDIPDLDYFHRMIKVADRNPKVNMLAFTKNYKVDPNICPQNLVIIPSAWPKHEIPVNTLKHNLIAWMQDGRENRIPSNNFECSKKCDECYKCWHINDVEKNVVFKKH